MVEHAAADSVSSDLGNGAKHTIVTAVRGITAVEATFRGLFVAVYFSWMAATAAEEGNLLALVQQAPSVLAQLAMTATAKPPVAPLFALGGPSEMLVAGLYGLAILLVAGAALTDRLSAVSRWNGRLGGGLRNSRR